MNINKKSSARMFLEKLRGGPLTFGNMLKSFRLADEISQADWAQKLNIPRAYLCDIEHGRRTVSVQKAAQFAKTLGYLEKQFVALALEDQLRDAGINAQVELKIA